MAQLHHVALYVRDLERARDFYTTYFDAVAGEIYHNRTTGLQTYFLHFASGGALELMTRPGHEKARQDRDLGWNHIALSLGDASAVDSLTARLQGDGFRVVSGPRTTGDGFYESCIEDLDGNLVTFFRWVEQ